MSLFVVDVEADGPVPGDFSMLSFGAVRVEEGLHDQYEAVAIKPITLCYDRDAIAAIGVSPEQRHERYVNGGADPKTTMEAFEKWLQETSKGRPIFISDNPAFDWMFICWYFHHFLGRNPFGFSARRLGDLYCGLVKDMRAQWKHLRKTPHDHTPLNDAKGNAEVVLYMLNNMGLK